MGYIYNKDGSAFYQRISNEPYVWERDTRTKIKPIEYATQEEFIKLNTTIENLRSFEKDTRGYLEYQVGRIDAIERAIGMDHWGTANELLVLKDYTEYLFNDMMARKGTHKRRRVIVKSGGQTVEVTRND